MSYLLHLLDLPKRVKLTAVTVTLVLVLLVGTLFSYLLLKGDGSQKIEVSKEISYKLDAKATDFQKVSFDELREALTQDVVDTYAVAGLIAKNFVADFYTWSNKQGSYDVGGLQYVYAPNTLYIQTEAKAYFYKDLSYFIQTYGADNLLKVNSVTIKYVDPEENYVIGDQSYPSYYVGVEWTYEPNSTFSPAEYQTKAYFSIMVRGGRYEIYRYYLQ